MKDIEKWTYSNNSRPELSNYIISDDTIFEIQPDKDIYTANMLWCRPCDTCLEPVGDWREVENDNAIE